MKNLLSILSVLIIAACANPQAPETKPAPVLLLKMTYNAISGEVSGNYAIIATISNAGNVPVRITAGAYNVYGSLGYVLTDTVTTVDTLTLESYISPNGTVPLEIQGNSSYIGYRWDVTLQYADANDTSKTETYTGYFQRVYASSVLTNK